MPTSPSTHLSLARPSSGGTSRDRRDETNGSLVKNLQRRRNLIMALVRREIEYLSTWHNTTADSNLSFPGEDQLNKWSAQTIFTKKIWKDLVKLAWHIFPPLAVHLCARSVVCCENLNLVDPFLSVDIMSLKRLSYLVCTSMHFHSVIYPCVPRIYTVECTSQAFIFVITSVCYQPISESSRRIFITVYFRDCLTDR